MNLKEVMEHQRSLRDKIRQFVSNCKKTAKLRRTSQFYVDKIRELQEMGDEFHQNHQAILTWEDKPDENQYLQRDDYKEIQKLIVDYTKTLEREALELEQSSAAEGGQKLETPEVRIRMLCRNQTALMQALQRSIAEIMANKNEEQPFSYYPIKAAVLEKHMLDFATNNAAIWESTEEERIGDYTLQKYYELEAQAEEAMIELQQHMRIEHTVQSPERTDRVEGEIKLPRISLPKFDGSYMRWVEFKDLYTELVHNTAISNSKKMHYLTTSLDNEPKNLIKHLPAVGANYSTAWSILTSRYDNKRLLVTSLLNKLMSQSPMKKETAATLKSLHDVTKECIHGLKAQEIAVQHWNAILTHIVLRKMDQATQTAFEQSLNDNKRLITIEEVLQFLERRFQSYEAQGNKETSATRTCASVTNSSQNNYNCPICKREPHHLYACRTFENADLHQRWRWVKEFNRCVNCLKSGHRADECRSGSCTKCSKNHNTLLHNPKMNQPNHKKASFQGTKSVPQQTAGSTTKNQNPSNLIKNNHEQSTSKVSLLTNNGNKDSRYILLGTAQIQVVAANGQHVKCRAILDSGSQINLITDRLLKKLGGKPRQMSMSIEGIGANETKMRHQTTICIKSSLTNFTAEIEAHIIPKIVSEQPVQRLRIENWGIPQDISLADPHFNEPGRIDCLLGAEIFFDLLTDGQIKLTENQPVLQNSVLGWIIAGTVKNTSSNKATCGICTNKELEEAISRFWEAEEIPESNIPVTEDELRCESHFLQHTYRDNSGRFVVKLPLKEHASVLANSKGMAYERFKGIEQRLMKNQLLREQYISFMREYESLGHMTEINSCDIRSPSYFIPHHCVVRPDSSTTKLRVVFDASAHKSTEHSLNDIMFNGPTVQSELFSILLRFRMHQYVMKTDIEKMYRQIWVNKEDRNLQLIMWRENPTKPIKFYQLNTVTYGTRAAPYLATRCLNRLAEELQGKYPYGAMSLKKDFYVDDGLLGADSMREALETQQQLITMLSGAGMKLRKWCANDPRLLRGIAPEDKEIDLQFNSEINQSTKTLGLLWLPKSDVFCFKANTFEHKKTTKRTVSSDLAHIYDPLGLIGPVIVAGKILLQNIWQLKLDWDEELPAGIQGQWTSYKNDLETLNNVKVERHIFGNHGFEDIELHAFSDASERAYGAAVYIRTVQKDKTIKLNLLCSKSRVAPIKLQTIPRLELCAALLAAELMARVKLDLDYQNKASYFWTDSQIVLSWIHNNPGKLPVYVAHRIIKIHRISISDQWRHVPSKQNPADILSRGLKPREFSKCNMWLYGPLFLYQPKSRWPAPFKRELTIENNTTAVTLVTKQSVEEHPWVYSIPSKNSFSHVQRIVGYVLRFIKNTRQPKDSRPEHTQLSPMELDAALKIIIRQIQSADFKDIKNILIKDKFVSKSNHLSSLTPFLDEEGIIRVGGRISSSEQQYDATHQMILPANDPLTRLLVDKIHKENYHCGTQALLAQVRQRFWPLKAKSLTRAVVQRCVICTKAKPIIYNQIMGNLPAHRVQPARPFLNSGVDFCGPFWVHFKTRGKKPQKAYLAVFCCFATKAVHLELVTDLTTDAFVGALKRFISRRGRCKTLYCDNATNFVGARNYLQELDDIIYSQKAKESIIGACSVKGMEFHFIPPRSPHFGGLWEAAVKSAKHLLIKNVSTASLTYEELETVVIEIEAILNSRPLIPNSSDANDLNAITPGHILIGEELTSTVDVHAVEPKRKLLDRWQLVSELKHNFWQRWSKEYLNELQQRHKWKGPLNDIQPNTMVIIKEDNLPVLKWPLGRIIKIYKGNDGLVRVCDVKTQKGIFKRPVHRLAPLFSTDDDGLADSTIENSTKQLSHASKEKEHHKLNQDSSRKTQVSLLVSIPLDRIRKTAALTNDSTPQKRSRIDPGLLLTILTLLMLPLALGNPINVTQFENKPGIYFEKLSNVKFATTNWNMVVYFDLGPLHQEMNLITDGTSTLQKLCDNAIDDSPCDFLLNFFDHIRDELQSKLNLLSAKRSKRGAVDIVGNVANSLFGILDENYATKMAETIDTLKKNDNYLEFLLKNQTSLIDSTINIIKENQLNTQAKFDEIDNRINDLLYGNSRNQSMQKLLVSQNIIMLSTQMSIMVSNLLWTYSSITDVLIDSHHEKINPLLITPLQLNEELVKIKAHLPPNLQLPIHQNNLLEMYKLSKVNGVVTKTHVIFSIQLPLADPKEFQLLHLVPIAAAINESLSEVKLSTRFLAISPHRDESLPMSQGQLDACLTLSEEELLCENIQPIYHKTSSVNKCEIDFLNNQAFPKCEFQALEERTVWYQLKHANHWIYATLNPIQLNVACEDEADQLQLYDNGLIRLRNDCTIKNDLVTIKGRSQIVTTMQTSSLKFSMPLGWSKQYDTNNISIKLFKPNIQDLVKIQKQLAHISESTLPDKSSTINTHSLFISYVAIALVIIAILVTTYKLRKMTKPTQPVPTPRQRYIANDTEC